jgi:hypothetical protein
MESLTPRLTGRRPTGDDADLLFTLLNDPDVARTMAGTRTPEQVADIWSAAADWRVLEKCGLVFEQEFEHFGLPHVFLRVHAGEPQVG